MFISALDAGKRDGRHHLTLGAGSIGLVAALIEVGAVTLVSTAAGVLWHQLTYGQPGDIRSFVDVGVLTGLFYALPFLLGMEYRIDHFVAGRRTLARILNVWTYAFFALAVLAFLTKSTGTASRGGLALFFVLGSATVVGTDLVLRRLLKALLRRGIARSRKLLVIGRPALLSAFVDQHSFPDTGVEIAGTVSLPDGPDAGSQAGMLEHRVDWALEMARSVAINDVLILLADEENSDLGPIIADRFMDLPVAVHLGHLPIATHYPGAHLSRIGRTRTLALRSTPLNPYQQALKRLFDVVIATVAIVLLAPALAVIALLIKLDSPGPAFFRQRRRGFNQREFAIWKFRTMSTLEDGADIKQAVAGDPRVTRIGRLLRRYNIDELPQLLNVIAGDMSLVGPRPHAVAHDRHYERVIRRYVRRLNVKPGITGWAQVNGFRGLTDTEHAMRSRIAHDLYYIDNWSLALDLYILLLTVLSPKAFRNAH